MVEIQNTTPEIWDWAETIGRDNETAHEIVSVLWETGQFFWELLHANGYNQLYQKQRNTLLWIMKVWPRNKQYLEAIFECQNAIWINDSLVYILEILMNSRFQYSIEDIYYLTQNSKPSRLDKNYTLSLKFFCEEKIYELWYFHARAKEGTYYKPFFFDALVTCRKQLGSENISLDWFINFYISFIEPKTKNILRLRKKPDLTKFLSSVQYLFSLGEPSQVWHKIHNILWHNAKFDFGKQKFESLDALEVSMWDELFSQDSRYKKVWKSLSVAQKKELFGLVSDCWKTQFISTVQWVLKKTKMSFQELTDFMLETGYSLINIHFFFLQKVFDMSAAFWQDKGEGLADYLKRYGYSVKEFFLEVQKSGLHNSQISLDTMHTIFAYRWMKDIWVLATYFDSIPNDYYYIQQRSFWSVFRHFSEAVVRDTTRILKIFSLLKNIMQLDASFRLDSVLRENLEDIEKLEERYAELLEKEQEKQSQALGIKTYESENYFPRFREEKGYYDTLMWKCEQSWYTKEEIVDFCMQTGYRLEDIENMLFFEEQYWHIIEGVSSEDLQRGKINFTAIIQAGFNATNMRADSIWYYSLLWYPLSMIRRMPFNYLMNNDRLWNHNEVTHERYILEIKSIQADFDFSIFWELYPEYFHYWKGEKIVGEIDIPTLRSILEILKLHPQFELSQISPYLLRYAGLHSLFKALLQSDRLWEIDYEQLHITLIEYITWEDLEEFFMQEADFDFHRDTQGITRKETVSQIDSLRSNSVKQSLSLASLPRIIEETLTENPEMTFHDVLKVLFTNQSQFTREQRFEIIIKSKRYYDSFNKVQKYSNKYPNAQDLLSQVNPYKVNYYEIQGKIECQQEGMNLTFYFSDEEDYYRCLWMKKNRRESGGMKLWYSQLPDINGTICFVNGPVWVENDFTQVVQIHENRHITNGFLFESNLPEDAAKDEIIAYMSDGTSQEYLVKILTSIWALYNYFEPLMYRDYARFEQQWSIYANRVERYISQAYTVASLYPDEYLDLLAVTPINRWGTILKTKV